MKRPTYSRKSSCNHNELAENSTGIKKIPVGKACCMTSGSIRVRQLGSVGGWLDHSNFRRQPLIDLGPIKRSASLSDTLLDAEDQYISACQAHVDSFYDSS